LFVSIALADRFDDLVLRAAAARQAGDSAAALALYREAVGIRPSWSEGWWYLGMISYDSDQYSDCRAAFSQFIKLESKSAPAWSFVGLCDFEVGAYHDALADFERADATGGAVPPEVEPVVRYHRALLLNASARFEEATRALKPLAAGSPSPALLTALGVNALRLPLLPQALPETQRSAVTAAGAIAAAWISGDSAAAEAGFRDLLRTYDTAPGAHYFYATYLLQSHPPAEVIPELRRELAVNPRNPDAHALLALMLQQTGAIEEALPHARQAAEARPGAPLTEYAYGVLLTDSGDVRDAIRHLEIAGRLEPNKVENHAALAKAYSKAGRYEDARRERAAAISLARGPDAH